MEFTKTIKLFFAIILIMQGCKESTLEHDLPSTTEPKNQFYNLNLAGVSLKVEVAALADERAKGLMFRETMGLQEGMLFIFKTGTEQFFWMKNTRIPLDIGYFSSVGELLELHKAKPHDLSGVPSRSKDIKFVLELNAGAYKKLGISIGDRLEMSEIYEILKLRNLNPLKYNISP
jgi:uncharacterized membrane protein (UPF0127 family)|tara:strand:+ start:90 stop:614 length:525 start_codon:yes stop_codon:yes gene_type:complete